MSTFSERVQSSTDDAYSFPGFFSNNSNFFTWGGHSATGPTFGTVTQIRFSNVTIPQGATIDSVVLQVTTPASGDVINVLSRIYGIAEDNTTTFSSNGDGRTKTSSFVDWNINGVALNTSYNSPDLTTIIQEIVNRSGWASGNALGFLVFDNGTSGSSGHSFIAYDWNTTTCPLITITYHVSPHITKSVQYTVKTTPTPIGKLLRYSVADLENALVPFIGLKVAKSGHNVLNTKKPDNLNFSTDYGTLKYFSNGHQAINVSHPVGTGYRDIAVINHSLGYYPFALVYAKDNAMSGYQPLGHYQIGSGMYRQFYYYLTTTQLVVVATGFTGISTGDTYTVDFYYKIFKNDLGL